MSDEPGLPDQEPGAEHPRAVFDLVGHGACERALAEALAGGRNHHAWLLTGPKGVGKATLAYRFARRLLGAAPADDTPLASQPDDPVCRKIAIGALPDLRTATRYDPEKDKVMRDVSVDAVRALTQFFTMKADTAGGRRVGIVDCADDMSVAAANALLKTLEEPPPGAILILIAHAPGGLLPTIRSRCRRLSLAPLQGDEMLAATPKLDPVARALAGGRPGRAMTLDAIGAGALYNLVSRHLGGLPRAPLDEALKLSDLVSDPSKFAAVFDILSDWLARAGRAGLGLPIEEIEPGESAILARLSASAAPDGAPRAYERIRQLRHSAEALNLDKGLALLEALHVARTELSPIH
jgi:DNA polymerase III subunit delta'